MASLTENEAKTMDFLVRNFYTDCNINQLARILKISPGGMFKILRKLKERGFLAEKRAGNNAFYKINFSSNDALDACKFAMTGKALTPYISVWIKDLEPVSELADISLLFGSVLKKGKEAGDIDILLVFGRKNLKKVEVAIEKLNKIKPKKLHAVYQTMDDLIENIKKRDKAILEEIRTGVVLKGRGFLVEAIKHGQS
ncbi:MAG: winged helix-turn-helix domain-containing protein [Nanoarchaeota archaeon]|nr:winged helix-turn-helix domain-containing protein [Nanoarchaeota archaeon]